MADGNVPKSPDYGEVRKHGENMRDGAESVLDAINERKRREDEMRRATEEKAQRLKDSSKQK